MMLVPAGVSSRQRGHTGRLPVHGRPAAFPWYASRSTGGRASRAGNACSASTRRGII